MYKSIPSLYIFISHYKVNLPKQYSIFDNICWYFPAITMIFDSYIDWVNKLEWVSWLKDWFWLFNRLEEVLVEVESSIRNPLDDQFKLPVNLEEKEVAWELLEILEQDLEEFQED